MTAEIGQFALILALLLAVAQALAPLWGAWRGDLALMAIGRNAALLQAAFTAIAFASLIFGALLVLWAMVLAGVAYGRHTPLALEQG